MAASPWRSELDAVFAQFGAHLGEEFGAQIVGIDLQYAANVLIEIGIGLGQLLAGGRFVESDDFGQLIEREIDGIDTRELVEQITLAAVIILDDLADG